LALSAIYTPSNRTRMHISSTKWLLRAVMKPLPPAGVGFSAPTLVIVCSASSQGKTNGKPGVSWACAPVHRKTARAETNSTSPNPLLRKEGANSGFLLRGMGTAPSPCEGEDQALMAPSPCEGEGRGGVF